MDVDPEILARFVVSLKLHGAEHKHGVVMEKKNCANILNVRAPKLQSFPPANVALTCNADVVASQRTWKFVSTVRDASLARMNLQNLKSVRIVLLRVCYVEICC